MMLYIQQMINTIWGEWFIDSFPEIYEPLISIVMAFFACYILFLTYKLWYFLLIGWWSK